MNGAVLAFMLVTVSPDGREIEHHGRFYDEQACEYAASIVVQNRHPLPDGVTVKCKQAVVVIASST